MATHHVCVPRRCPEERKHAEPRVLTEPYIKALKAAPPGQRYAVADALVPGLKVRVTDRGAKSFILWRRYGGAANPAARALGSVGVLTLAAARDKARELDRDDQAGSRSAPRPAEREDNSFGVVMEEYLKRHVAGKRKAKDVEREIRKELLPRWRSRSLASITRKDVTQLVDEIKDRGAPYQAHNMLGHAKTFFNWAIERGIYGMETSPCDRIKPSRLIGPKAPRQRVLSDIEIAAFWRATGRRVPDRPAVPAAAADRAAQVRSRRGSVARVRSTRMSLDDPARTLQIRRHSRRAAFG